MSRNCPITISLDNPCQQDWEQMLPAEQGRYCSHCSKTVIDFTTWTDAALYQFFAANPQHVCGRFLTTQLERPINIPHQPHSRLYRLTVALGLTLLFTQATDVLAQQKPPAVMAPPVAANKVTGTCEIAGVVIDEKREPMISAGVRVLKEGQPVASTVSDLNGNYLVKQLVPGAYRVEIIYTGYDTMVITDVLVQDGQQTKLNNSLKLKAGTNQIYIKQGGAMGRSLGGARTQATPEIRDMQVPENVGSAKHTRKKWWKRRSEGH